MGRRAQGWRLKWKRGGPGVGTAHVIFTWQGVETERSTGESDPRRASERAAQLYADVVSGDGKRRAGQPTLEGLVTMWLRDTSAPRTFITYAKKLLSSRDGVTGLVIFDALASIRKPRVQRYIDTRLKSVTGLTVRCEYYALRNFCRWLVANGYLSAPPELPPPPPTRSGTRANPARKSRALELTVEEIDAIVAASPEWSESALACPTCSVTSM